jgi:hypothetical protein
MNAASNPAPSSDSRGRIVVITGSATTLLALMGVFFGAHHGVNVMGWYANYVIPAGAILVGLVAASGYGIAARLTGLKMTRMLIWSVVIELAISYFVAQYEEFTHFTEDASLGSFFAWFDAVTRAFAWANRTGGGAGEPFGIWGYAMRALEIAGFVLGGAMVPVLLKAKPYCDPCRTYKRTRALAHVSCGVQRGLLGGAKGDTEAAYREGLASVDTILAAARSGQPVLLQQELQARGLGKRAAFKLTSFLMVNEVRCPRCSAGAIESTQMTRNGNNWTRTRLSALPLSGDQMRALLG